MESLDRFWVIVEQVWTEGAFGVDVGRIGVALLIFLGFLVLRGLFARYVLARIKRLTALTETDFDDDLVAAIERPLKFVPVVVGVFFALDHMGLEGAPAEVAGNIVRTLVTYTLFWGLYAAVDPISATFRRLEAVFTTAMVQWLVKALKIAVILIGGATILELWGIEVAPILAGLGLFGVAVALGAQDLFKNLIAGILIIAERRFSVGDWVRVDGVVEGTVENIGFRSTKVRRFDKAPVYVPNAKFADSAVTNFSAMTHRRIYWKIGVEYRTTVAQLRQIRDGIEQYLIDNEAFARPEDATRFVRIDSFNDSSIDIMLYCFTKTTNWGEWLAIKEELAYALKNIVEGAGSGFAFPSQSVYVESLPGEAPELFTPPPEKAAT